MTSYVNRKCVKCGKTRADDLTVTFHRFPISGGNNLTKASAWAKFCWPDQNFSREQLQAIHNSSKVLCGRHFKSKDFYDIKRQKLSKFAVPATEEDARITEDYECDKTSMDTTSSDDNGTPTAMLHTENTKKERSGAILNNKLNEMTPREVKLYKLCRNKIRQILRLRKTVKNRKGILDVVSKNDNVKKLTELNISNPLFTLLQSQLKKIPIKLKGQRFTLEQKLVALILYKKSAACYRLLRRLFALPCQSSLDKLLDRVPLQPGLNSHIFTALKDMAHNQAPEDNLCILSFDEMAIRKHLSYNSKSDVIEGYEDHGNHGRSNNVATKAIVFMLAGLEKKWKQPIAFYLSHAINADRMTVILKEVLEECFKAGMKVVATVCDLSTVNINVLRTLGVTTQEPYFSFYGTEIVAVLDPPHLLKYTRNLFMKHNIECDTGVQIDGNPIKGTAKWSDIQQFYNLEKSTPGYDFAPALTDKHLSPNLKQQMRVKLAAEVFSHSVTTGMHTRIAYNQLPSSALATTKILDKFDNLFDAVTSDTSDLRRGKPYANNISRSSSHLMFYSEMRHFISSMKYIGSKGSPPSQEGLLHSLNAIERLWENVQKLNITSLSTRRLNQDPLENFFACVRYSSGSNNNPTTPQFVSGVKTAIITNLRHSGRKRNCAEDDLSLSNNLRSFLKTGLPPTVTQENVCILESMVADAIEKVDLVTPVSQACGYVIGFIFNKLKYNDCPDCLHTLLRDFRQDKHVFTSLNEYRLKDSLVYVTKEMAISIEIMAGLVNELLSTGAWKNELKRNVIAELDKVDVSFLNGCLKHAKINAATIQTSVFYICLKRFIIMKNREIENVEKESDWVESSNIEK